MHNDAGEMCVWNAQRRTNSSSISDLPFSDSRVLRISQHATHTPSGDREDALDTDKRDTTHLGQPTGSIRDTSQTYCRPRPTADYNIPPEWSLSGQTRAIDRLRKWNLRFTGKTDVIPFLGRLEELADIYEVDMHQLPRLMPELLTEKALQWFRNNNKHRAINPGRPRPSGNPFRRTNDTAGASQGIIENFQQACRRCGQMGHRHAGCRNPQVLFCWLCGKRGTRTIHCCKSGNQEQPQEEWGLPRRKRKPPHRQSQTYS